jgi:hypothetical protein
MFQALISCLYYYNNLLIHLPTSSFVISPKLPEQPKTKIFLSHSLLDKQKAA